MAEYDALVTVVISVYNKEAYIGQAIESVVEQTYENLDIIIVDDGSTDNSCGVIQRHAGRDPRIRFHKQQNSGVASCRNRGLTDSDGRYIVFLDGDDYLYPSYIETAVRCMVRNQDVDLLHVSWDYVDEKGMFLNSVHAREKSDYLRALLLGNMFAIHGVFCRMSFLKRVGLFEFYTVTDDWEYWIRCAREGGHFKALNKRLVATRKYAASNKKIKAKQKLRFFPIIDKVFTPSYGLPDEYRLLERLSRIRHHFFLLENYEDWNWKKEAEEQFKKVLEQIRQQPVHWRGYSFILSRLSIIQKARLSLVYIAKGAFKQMFGMWLGPMRLRRAVRQRWAGVKRVTLNRLISAGFSVCRRLELLIHRSSYSTAIYTEDAHTLGESITVSDIVRLTLSYIDRQRYIHEGEFAGYRFSASTTRAVLYATLAALLTKHLFGFRDEQTDIELEYVLGFQCDDGLFRDPVISCPQADGMYHGWGWRHLTLLALMTLALHEVPASKEIPLLEPYDDPNRFRKFLESRDWEGQAASVGNEMQNIGVILQYARDFQGEHRADLLLEVMYEVIDSHQDPESGLYGDTFQTGEQIAQGVVSAYHLWLLYFYEKRAISRVERIIDSVLSTQNILGGYGMYWNSSACEDIDSIDPLVRLTKLTDYRREEMLASLQQALPAVLRNLNSDGGWVFRRHETNFVIHPQMYSAPNESNMLYTWFRALSLAYILTGLDHVPKPLVYQWQFRHVPGHQFPVSP